MNSVLIGWGKDGWSSFGSDELLLNLFLIGQGRAGRLSPSGFFLVLPAASHACPVCQSGFCSKGNSRSARDCPSGEAGGITSKVHFVGVALLRIIIVLGLAKSHPVSFRPFLHSTGVYNTHVCLHDGMLLRVHYGMETHGPLAHISNLMGTSIQPACDSLCGDLGRRRPECVITINFWIDNDVVVAFAIYIYIYIYI